ncbi:hypothetical protein D0466_05415 [Peribacillus glennii]|uniref:Uncharacterized protein n=1 Tax=Peribacillus glennii TaxID=2303991 RepID=A0A372LGA7_9BACI|nr:hypothetical protein D0466_05415 [Peribacillus glennii]
MVDEGAVYGVNYYNKKEQTYNDWISRGVLFPVFFGLKRIFKHSKLHKQNTRFIHSPVGSRFPAPGMDCVYS